MVPVWGWGTLLCLVLKAHHSLTQSLSLCGAHSRGNRTGRTTLCSATAALVLTGIRVRQSSYLLGGEEWGKKLKVKTAEIVLNQHRFSVEIVQQGMQQQEKATTLYWETKIKQSSTPCGFCEINWAHGQEWQNCFVFLITQICFWAMN